MRLERADLRILVVYALVVGLLTLVVPFAVQALVNTAGFGASLQPLVVLSGLVLLGLGFSSAVQLVQTHVVESLRRRVFVRVAGDLAGRLPRVQMAAFDGAHGPEIVNRFFDVLTIQKSASGLLLDGLSIVVQSLIGLALVSLYHPALLLYSVGVASGLAGILVLAGKGGIETAVRESKAKYAVAAWLEEVARHPVAFKSQGGPTLAVARVDVLLNQYLTLRATHFGIFMRQLGLLLALYTLASAVLLGVGGWLVILGQLSLGQLVAAEFIVTMVVGGFAKLGKQIETHYDLMAAMDKLGHLTDLPLEPVGPSPLPAREGPMAVVLDAVAFTYPDGPEVLRGVSLTVRPGERIGILGHGTGKSTLLDLLYGLRRPSAGTLTLDGVEVRELDPASARSQIELLREIEIFEGSLLDNVRMGRGHVSDEAAREALGAVNLLERANRLPVGLHSELYTGGSPLSPNEARRLMLARAIAGRPRLLLLDEALGHLDMASEAIILDRFFAPEAPWTLITVTYNPRALARCQRVYKLEGGTLVEITGSSAASGEERTDGD